MGLLESRQAVDMTFGQGIAPFGDPSEPYHSIDLTAATDRFPVEITEIILSQLYDNNYARAWRELMTGEKFLYEGKYYSYNTGQPMGMYSSWASFALSHHLIVQWASMKSGNTKLFRDYRLLGDDIVIRNAKVATEYLNILRNLGIEVSLSKTMVSKDTFEFAKRLFLQETEVTGFPLAGVVNTIGRWSELCTVLKEGQKRGYPNLLQDFDLSKVFFLLAKQKLDGFGKPKRFYLRLVRKMKTLDWL